MIETDIEACFRPPSTLLIGDDVRRRIADKRVLALVRAFLKAGLMSETGRLERTVTGTPQGGIASPLLANIALSALDRHYQANWQEMSRYHGRRQYLQRRGHPTYRLVRYADDLVVLVKGAREQARALLDQLAGRVEALGLSLVREDRGHPHRRGLRVPRAADRPSTQGQEAPRLYLRLKRGAGLGQTQGEGPDRALHDQLGAVRADRSAQPGPAGWGNHFWHAAAKRTLVYLGYYAWWRVGRWLRKKHPRPTWKQIQRRYASEGAFQEHGIALFSPGSISVRRYRYRAARIPNPWNVESTADPGDPRARRAGQQDQLTIEHVQQALARTETTRGAHGEPDAVEVARPVRRATARKPPAEKASPAPRRRPYLVPQAVAHCWPSLRRAGAPRPRFGASAKFRVVGGLTLDLPGALLVEDRGLWTVGR